MNKICLIGKDLKKTFVQLENDNFNVIVRQDTRLSPPVRVFKHANSFVENEKGCWDEVCKVYEECDFEFLNPEGI